MTIPTESNVAEVKENIQSSVQENASQQEAPPQPISETKEQINWRKFREAREAERKQNEILKRESDKKAEEIAALKAALEAVTSQNNIVKEEEETDDHRLNKRIEEILLNKEKQIEEQRRIREQQELPVKLQSTYQDFNQVCKEENLDYLEYHYPEVAEAFKKLPDSFEKWAGIYKAIKRFIPNPDTKKEEKKIERNAAKPQSMSVAGLTQTNDTAPHYLDEKRKADNWARMQRTLKTG